MPPAEGMGEDFDLPDDPVLKVGEEKEIGNQGLKKKLLKEGEGWDTPDNGDEVEGIKKNIYLREENDFQFVKMLLSFRALCSNFCSVGIEFENFQFTTLEHCLMELNLTRVVTEELHSNSPLAKVRNICL